MTTSATKIEPLPRSARSARRKIKSRSAGKTDWARLDAMSDEEVIAAALRDPDNLPLTEEYLKRMKPRPRVFVIRRALRMTQEKFADAYRIPLGTLRDWEQGRTEPDQANRAYLKVIAVAPEFVRQALLHRPGMPKPKPGSA